MDHPKMLNKADIRDIFLTELESAEEYDIDEAPAHYTQEQAQAWLAGRVAILQKLDKMCQLSIERLPIAAK